MIGALQLSSRLTKLLTKLKSALPVGVAVYFGVVAPGVSAQQPRGPVPPPPAQHMEFLNPTYVQHRSHATCQAAQMTIEWRYNADGVAVTALTFNRKGSETIALQQINAWLKDFPGDALAVIECGNDGANIAFVEAHLAGSQQARIVKFSWVDGRPRLIGRYRFQNSAP